MTWLIGWNRRKQLYINGTTAGTQSAYQMKIVINYSGGDNAGSISCDGHVNSNFSDIRFTDTNGNLLFHWIDDYSLVSGSLCEVWIKIPSIPTGPNSTYIYFYYDNPSASTISNGQNTFPLLFDDFTGTNGSSPDITKWTLNQTGNGKTDIQNNYLETIIPTGGNGYVLSNATFTLPIIVEFRAKWPGWGNDDYLAHFASPDHGIFFGQTVSSSSGHLKIGDYACCSGDASGWTLWTGYSINTWYHFRWTISPNTLKTEELINNNSDTHTISSSNSRLYFGDNSPHAAHTINFDNVWVRSYASPEPTWSSNIIISQATLNITSNITGAEVWLRTPAGSGPYLDQGVATNTTIGVAPGTYDIELILSGGQTWYLLNQNYITGNTYNIQATFSGQLFISSTPTGAEVWISGYDYYVQTNTTLTGLNPSPPDYNITLKHDGYQDWTGSATVYSTLTTSINATFAGSANIISNPSGAAIYLDGSSTKIGNTPLIITGMTSSTSDGSTPTQSHTYISRLTGYADTSGSFIVTAGQTVNVPVTFPGSLNITSIPTGAQIYIDGILQ